MSDLAVGPDTFVTVSYELFDESGLVADRATTAEPLHYVHGYAQIMPGLEAGLAGLHAGDKRSITVTAEDGFGEKDDEAMFEVEKTDFPNHADVKPGDEFLAEGPEGESIAMRVVEVLDETFVVDANHPLAGQTLRFEVLVSEVRPATEEEIAEAQSDLEEMIERADEPCCDHDHGDDTHTHEHDEQPRLVQLAKKS